MTPLAGVAALIATPRLCLLEAGGAQSCGALAAASLPPWCQWFLELQAAQTASGGWRTQCCAGCVPQVQPFGYMRDLLAGKKDEEGEGAPVAAN